AGHTTTLLYLGLIWALFVVWAILLDPNQKISFSVWFYLRSLVLGLLVSAVQLLPTLQLIRYSGRLSQGGFEFATRFSLPWGQIVSLLIPEWYGEPTRIGYWGGENFEELTAYPGIFAAAAFLFAVFIFRRKNWRSWQNFFVLLGLIGILIGLGSNGFLYGLLYQVFPPFRVMRAPGRALFFVAFSAPVLLGLLIHHLQVQTQHGSRYLRNQILISVALWFGLMSVLWLSWSMAQNGDIVGRRWHQFQNVAIVGAVLVAGSCLWLWLTRNAIIWGQGMKLFVMSGMLLLLVFDLGWFGRKLIEPQPMTPNVLWFEAAQILNEGEQIGRILPWGINIFLQNGAGQVGLDSIFGYNTLENGAITSLAASVPDPRSPAYDVLAVTHVVAEAGLEQFTTGSRGLNLQNQINRTRVFSRPTALPYVRLVGAVETVQNSEMLLERLHHPDFDPSQIVLFTQESDCVLTSGFDNGQVDVVERRPGYLQLTVQSDEPAYLIVAETAFPGWTAQVNGRSTPVEPAYGAIQAVCLPEGASTVILNFRPFIFLWGGLFSLLGLVICLLMWRRQSK
ncbi:MAG: hypothetical protein AAGD96_16890, partial [Chloroflexota bacterium]